MEARVNALVSVLVDLRDFFLLEGAVNFFRWREQVGEMDSITTLGTTTWFNQERERRLIKKLQGRCSSSFARADGCLHKGRYYSTRSDWGTAVEGLVGSFECVQLPGNEMAFLTLQRHLVHRKDEETKESEREVCRSEQKKKDVLCIVHRK